MPNDSAQFSPCSLLTALPCVRQEIGCRLPPFFTTFCSPILVRCCATASLFSLSRSWPVVPRRRLHRVFLRRKLSALQMPRHADMGMICAPTSGRKRTTTTFIETRLGGCHTRARPSTVWPRSEIISASQSKTRQRNYGSFPEDERRQRI